MARSIRNFWQHPKSCTLIVKQEKNLFGSVNFRCFHTRSSADVHSTRGAHKDLGRCQKCRDFLIRRMFFAVPEASASVHLWEVNEAYSNSDGSVQFVELKSHSNFQTQTNNTKLISIGASDYTLNGNLTDSTMDKHLLIATETIASVVSDFVTSLLSGFLTNGEGNTLIFTRNGVALSLASLPIYSVMSLNRTGGINAQVTPTNFDDDTATLPEPFTGALANLALLIAST